MIIGASIAFVMAGKKEKQLRQSIARSEDEIKAACRQLNKNADELERLHSRMDKARSALTSTSAAEPAPHGAAPGDLH